MTLIVSEVAAVAAAQVVTRVVTTVGTSAVVSAAAGGGAMATGTAGGGAAGTSVGPVGTLVGAGVGLIIGVGVDWWLTDQFQEKLTSQLNTYFDEMQRNLLDGTVEEPGLRDALSRVVDLVAYEQSKTLRQSLKASE